MKKKNPSRFIVIVQRVISNAVNVEWLGNARVNGYRLCHFNSRSIHFD